MIADATPKNFFRLFSKKFKKPLKFPKTLPLPVSRCGEKSAKTGPNPHQVAKR
jgi:hypothetical protein